MTRPERLLVRFHNNARRMTRHDTGLPATQLVVLLCCALSGLVQCSAVLVCALAAEGARGARLPVVAAQRGHAAARLGTARRARQLVVAPGRGRRRRLRLVLRVPAQGVHAARRAQPARALRPRAPPPLWLPLCLLLLLLLPPTLILIFYL